MSAWPAFETRPSRSFPPVECWRGTSPSQAAKSRPLRKVDISGAKASIASAVSGPTPGIVCNRRDVSARAASSFAVFVLASIRPVFSPICARRSELADPLREDVAVLVENAAQRVHEFRALVD